MFHQRLPYISQSFSEKRRIIPGSGSKMVVYRKKTKYNLYKHADHILTRHQNTSVLIQVDVNTLFAFNQKENNRCFSQLGLLLTPLQSRRAFVPPLSSLVNILVDKGCRFFALIFELAFPFCPSLKSSHIKRSDMWRVRETNMPFGSWATIVKHVPCGSSYLRSNTLYNCMWLIPSGFVL